MGEGTGDLTGGYGIPDRTAVAKEPEQPPHPSVQELRGTIEQLKMNLKEARGTVERLYRQIEEMVVQAKEGL